MPVKLAICWKFQFTPLREGRRETQSGIRRSKSFQFTPLREGRLAPTFGQAPFELFQFTPLREGRPQYATVSYVDEKFQFTPLREGRPVSSCNPFLRSSYFNSRPSARGDKITGVFLKRMHYFNSRPSARGDAEQILGGLIMSISIHAPPRGATYRILE